MIYTVSGTLAAKKGKFAVVEVGGLGLKLLIPPAAAGKLPAVGAPVKFFSFLYGREEGFELYGFLTEEELEFFEALNAISGVGPKSALAVISLDKIENLKAAIVENRAEILSRASGVGRKTAERIILELKNKIELDKSGELVKKMESDFDLLGALVQMGYARSAAREALKRVPGEVDGLEKRLKEALKILGRKGGNG